MREHIIKKEYSCLVFGEGGRDKKFLMALIDLEKFQYFTSKWFFNYGNASGGSAQTILEKCKREVAGHSYDLVLCFIDLDDLKRKYPKKWNEEKDKIQDKYQGFKIIWQLDNAEDEYKKVLGDQYLGKHQLNKAAKERVKDFINSNFWKRIMQPIKEKEKELEEQKSQKG